MLAGSQWLNGHGVDVHSNGCAGCGSPAGSYDTDGADGYPWQCVELFDRLMLDTGWYTGHVSTESSGPSNGGAVNLYPNAPTSAFDKHANGSGYIPVPGDAIVFSGDTYGHVAIVNYVDSAGVHVVEQNAVPPNGQETLALHGSTIDPPAYSNLTVEGILHPKADPYTTASGSGSGSGSGYQPPDSPDGYQHLFGLQSSGEPDELCFEPDVANTMGEGPLMSTPGTVDIASTVDSAGDIIVYTLGSDGSVYQVYYKPGVAGTMGEGYIGTLPGAIRISAVTGPDGYQHILGMTESGLVEELYYEPSVANTTGEGPLMSTPGTVDIAAATDSEGYINVYTLGSDGSVYSVYYKPAVAGTMGEGPLEPIPGATELSAVG